MHISLDVGVLAILENVPINKQMSSLVQLPHCLGIEQVFFSPDISCKITVDVNNGHAIVVY